MSTLARMKQERRERQRYILMLLAASAVPIHARDELAEAVGDTSPNEYDSDMMESGPRDGGWAVFELVAAAMGIDIKTVSSDRAAHTINKVWGGVMASVVYALAHGQVPLDEDTKKRVEDMVGQKLPEEVKNFATYWEWAAMAASAGGAWLSRAAHPYAKAAGAALLMAAPLLAEKAGEERGEEKARHPAPRAPALAPPPAAPPPAKPPHAGPVGPAGPAGMHPETPNADSVFGD